MLAPIVLALVELEAYKSKILSQLRKNRYRILHNQSPILRGEDVKAVQRAVAVATDAVVGPATETTVRNYQEARGLEGFILLSVSYPFMLSY
ncbi:hypothetical protein CHH72_03180 [Shouchella clausii]|uniref:Peptidoglycan binding-like domain-containing protein n=1 Tax=Shouchella clausii TaxID=79880 RepID=A0A268P2L2_SHOCL|nr:hypothetical protein CHH72_03180 [Shouchella clausii]